MTEDKQLQIIDAETEETALTAGPGSLAAFDHRQKLLDHALKCGIQATSFGDWQDYGGKPYLQGSGAEKMLPKLPGFKIKNVRRNREDFEDKKGPYYVYTVEALASFYTTEMEVIGQCSSRYHVSAKRKNEPNRPMEEINVTDVMADAYSDMVRNAVARIFGLRNCEWKDLEKVWNFQGEAGVATLIEQADLPSPGGSRYRFGKAKEKNVCGALRVFQGEPGRRE